MTPVVCPVCGVRYCALLATSNGSDLWWWRETHPRITR